MGETAGTDNLVNVPVVANGKAPQANRNCRNACVDFLLYLTRSGMIVLDDRKLIIREYVKHLNKSGQPGLGDAFIRWVLDNQATMSRCEQVHVTPRNGDMEDLLEFPNVHSLADFDRNDRKYVAVALGSQNNPLIVNAVDSDWWNFRVPFQQNGVQLKFLCPQHMTGT